MIQETDPVTAEGGSLSLLQSGFFQEGENFDDGQLGFDGGSDSNEISGDDYAPLSQGPDVTDPADFVEFDFSLDYTIPADQIRFEVREMGAVDGDGVPELVWEVDHSNGETYLLDANATLGAGLNTTPSWETLPRFGGGNPDDLPDFEPGTHTLRCRVTNSDGVANQYFYHIDAVAPVDNRFTYDFDETTDANDALDGPELFPDVVPVNLTTASTQRNVTEASVQSSWTDVSTNQYIEVRIGDDAFDRTDNSETASTTGGPDTSIDVRLGLSRFGSGATTSPTTGFNGQSVNSYQLFANPDAITVDGIGTANVQGIIPNDDAQGQTFAEAALLSESDVALTRSVIPEFDKGDFQVISGEALRWRNDPDN